MNAEQAGRVRVGDTVVYEKARRQVVGVSRDGLWAPYFELDGDGVVSHPLVHLAKAEATRKTARA